MLICNRTIGITELAGTQRATTEINNFRQDQTNHCQCFVVKLLENQYVLNVL